MTEGNRYMRIIGIKSATKDIVSKVRKSFLEICEYGEPTSGTLIIINDFPMQKKGKIPSDKQAYNRDSWLNLQFVGDWKADRTDLNRVVPKMVDALMDEVIKSEQNDTGIPSEEKIAGIKGYWNADNGKASPETVFGGNYPRLRLLKKKYDPENIFNKWYAIEPAV
jgi:Berberine and berberine like